MRLSLDCVYCIVKKADKLYSQYETNEKKKLSFMKKVFKIVSDFKEDDTAPYLNSKIMKLLNEELNINDPYFEIKKEYNKMLESLENEILSIIYSSEDKLITSLKYAMVGNFIDFGAMDTIDVKDLNNIINSAKDMQINDQEYKTFKEQIEYANRLVYLTDNAGEIVFDKVFIKILKELYPNLNIDVIVRGKPILNDATLEDAKEVGLCNIVNVIDNGTAIPGTQLDQISDEARCIIDNADLIISKGQGNFETLLGCGKNIYYVFLCKCDIFTKRFNIEKFKGVFINERNIKEII
jgi:hypothetical protein